MNRLPSYLLLATFAGGLLSAQDRATDLPTSLGADLVTPVHDQIDDQGVAYGLWAAGRDYKVCFDDGARFVPYLGRLHPVSESLHWRTASVRVGEHELLRREPLRSHGELRVEFDHGGVIEAYDVRAEGLEQTFVLAQPVAGEGELVVRGQVGGTLHAVGERDGAVAFADASGAVVVEYGAATAIDADGRRRTMTTRIVDGGLELRLDGAWLAGASYPVVVDPLLTPVQIAAGTELEGVDILRDPFANAPLYIVDTRYAAADDADLRLWHVTDNGSPVVSAYSDITSSWSSVQPSLGVDNTTGRLLCAWTRQFVSTGVYRVRLHRHVRTDVGFDNSVFFVEDPEGRNCWRPDVGSDLSPSSTGTLPVVYQVESTGAFAEVTTSQIRGSTVDVTGAGLILWQFVVADAPLTDHAWPSVATVNSGITREWTIAWQSYLNFAVPPNDNDWEVRVQRAGTLGMLGTPFTIPGAEDQHQMTPRIAGVDDRLMVFCIESSRTEAGSKPDVTTGHRIRGARLDYGVGGFSLPHGVKLLQSNADARLQLGGAAFDQTTRSHWGLTFRSTATERVYLRTYGYTGSEVSNDLLDEAVGGTCVAGGIAARYSGFVTVCGLNQPGGGVVHYSGRSWPTLAKSLEGPSSCNGTTLSWLGYSVIGTENCGVQMQNMPANTFGAVFLASTTATLQVFGLGGVHDGCWLLVPISGPDSLGLMGPGLGPIANFYLSLPEFVAPQTLWFQGIVYDPAFGEFFSTQRLAVNIGY